MSVLGTGTGTGKNAYAAVDGDADAIRGPVRRHLVRLVRREVVGYSCGGGGEKGGAEEAAGGFGGDGGAPERSATDTRIHDMRAVVVYRKFDPPKLNLMRSAGKC